MDFGGANGYKESIPNALSFKEPVMAITAGSPLPHAKFKIMTETGPAEISTDELFKGKKAVLFAVPGAFTPTCTNSHLPGFLHHAADLKAKGVDVIACTSVNDVFVMDAWSKASGAKGTITFLADGNGDFAKAVGLELDGAPIGFGIRSKRYAMLLDDGVVKKLHVEDTPGTAIESSAEKLLSDL